jgi:mRNA-degrading endonuclease toxin of MazEF toxin-antitoxin module
MRYSDIKEKYVYYVDFNPVRPCEFNNNHLAVVLKKNNDKKTAIVMPLTSKENGVGTNKMLLPTIKDLPARLKGDDSYAVYDQVRSVNYSRFQPIFKNTTGMVVVDVKIDDEVFLSIIEKGVEELEKKLSLEEKLELYSKKLHNSVNEKIVNLAYEIKKTNEEHQEKIASLESKIRETIYNTNEFSFSEKERQDGIEEIILKIIKN